MYFEDKCRKLQQEEEKKVLFYIMLLDLQNSFAFRRFPDFASLSFWKERHIDECVTREHRWNDTEGKNEVLGEKRYKASVVDE